MINLRQLQFTKDKGILVAFTLLNKEFDIDADFQFSSYDLRGSDRFYKNLSKAKYGIEKIVFGYKQAASRKRFLTEEDSEQSGSVEIGIDTIKFGCDDEGEFVLFTMSAGIKNFENVGMLKLPKAYYKKKEQSYNLFPEEDQNELMFVKDEAENMIHEYLLKIGRACDDMFRGELIKSANELIEREVLVYKSPIQAEA